MISRFKAFLEQWTAKSKPRPALSALPEQDQPDSRSGLVFAVDQSVWAQMDSDTVFGPVEAVKAPADCARSIVACRALGGSEETLSLYIMTAPHLQPSEYGGAIDKALELARPGEDWAITGLQLAQPEQVG